MRRPRPRTDAAPAAATRPSTARALALGGGFGLACIAVVYAAYHPSLHAPFTYDDVVFRNSTVTQVSGLRDVVHLFSLAGVPRKISMATFALNFLADGFRPIGYHLVNVTLHALVGLVLFGFARQIVRLSKRLEPPNRTAMLGIGAGTLVWLLHPVQSQPVIYVWQRATLLSALFVLLALFAWLRARTSPRPLPWFFASAAAGAVALAAKENAGILPALVLLIEAAVLWPRRSTRSSPRLVPVLLALVSTLVVALYYLGSRFPSMIQADYLRRGFTPVERLLTEARVVLHYIGLLVWPHPDRLTLDYDFPLSHSLLDPPTTVVAVAAIACLIGLGFWLLKRAPLAGLAVLWFFANLVIESTIIPLDLVYEHRLYLPSMLPLVFAAAGLVQAAGGWRPGVVVATLAVLVLLGTWTNARARVWADPVALWADAARKAPQKARVHGNLAHALLERGDYDRAWEAYAQALALDPGLRGARSGQASILIDLRGDYAGAERLLKEALAQDERDVSAWINLGVLELRRQRPQEARRALERALAEQPLNPVALFNYGSALFNLGEFARARDVVADATRVWPADARMHALLALVLQATGENVSARTTAARARRLAPADPFVQGVAARVLAAGAPGSAGPGR